jgi:hypothetical protein
VRILNGTLIIRVDAKNPEILLGVSEGHQTPVIFQVLNRNKTRDLNSETYQIVSVSTKRGIRYLPFLDPR